MISFRFAITVFLFLITQISLAKETVSFDMFLFGNKIGSMVVTSEIRPDHTEFFTLETKSSTVFLWKKRSNFTRYEVTYKDGKLINSTHKELENGDTVRWTNIHFNGKIYEVDSYKGKRTFSEAPTFSIVTVYFKDVQSVKRIFYEPEATFSSFVKSSEPDTWEFKSSDGNRNIYKFKNGKIHELEFHVSIVTVKMIRTN